eukprot:jgi/Psemu1/1664/gm1.1664_g
MEAKTYYSSVAAKPPPKANDAPPTNSATPKNPAATKRNPDRFVGHNQTDLKGILIPEDASAKHYNELKDRLETLGGSKYIPQPTAVEYSTPVTDPVTQDTQMVKVPGLKETLMDMYKEELKKKADEWIQYQRDTEKMYRNTIDSSKCIVELLKAVRDLCFQSSQTKVHPITNVLRAIRKLLCTQQRNTDAASYVKMVKENLDVVKSLGGTLVCKATVSYKLEHNPAYSIYDYLAYLALSGPTRAAIDQAVEQWSLAALIIEGTDTDSSNLRQVLANNYALQQNNYPATSVEALDMVVAFKDSKKSKSQNGSRNTPATAGTNQNGRQRDQKKDESSPNQGSSLFTQQGTGGSTNLAADQHIQRDLHPIQLDHLVYVPEHWNGVKVQHREL